HPRLLEPRLVGNDLAGGETFGIVPDTAGQIEPWQGTPAILHEEAVAGDRERGAGERTDRLGESTLAAGELRRAREAVPAPVRPCWPPLVGRIAAGDTYLDPVRGEVQVPGSARLQFRPLPPSRAPTV